MGRVCKQCFLTSFVCNRFVFDFVSIYELESVRTILGLVCGNDAIKYDKCFRSDNLDVNAAPRSGRLISKKSLEFWKNLASNYHGHYYRTWVGI